MKTQSQNLSLQLTELGLQLEHSIRSEWMASNRTETIRAQANTDAIAREITKVRAQMQALTPYPN